MKNVIPAVLSALFGTFILVAFADAARQGIVMHLLDRGYPQLIEGDAPVFVRRIEWPDRAVFTFGEFSDARQVLTLDGWQIAFSPAPLETSYDTSCGYDCGRALRVRGMSCAPPFLATFTSTTVACELHAWTVADAKDVCFFSIEGDLPKPQIQGIDAPLPRELYFECPLALGWAPR